MFDGLDALLLARIQFAFTVSFHFIFPAFSIGLASYLMVLEGLWLKTGKALYLADFLEPGRKFMREERTTLASRVPRDLEGAFRACVLMRIEWTLHKGGELFPETVALWNAVR